MSLEELVIRHAIGQHVETFHREQQAAGVMMIPVPKAGILGEVRGKAAARTVDGVTEVNITILSVVRSYRCRKVLGISVLSLHARTPRKQLKHREAHRRLEFVILA